MTNLTTLGLSFLFAVPPVLAADTDIASPWLQLGLGGFALFVLYNLLKPLVKSQTDSNKRVVVAMEKLAEQQAAMTEIQRTVLTHSMAAAKADAALAQALQAVGTSVIKVNDAMFRHFDEDRAFHEEVRRRA